MEQQGAVIKVIGVGGGGSNAVNRMIEAGIQGVEFVVMNTDAQALDRSQAPRRLQLGTSQTRGLGAGGDPERGRAAADESKNDIRKILEGSDMVFIAAGMGGGTGTGAAPIVAELAREVGAVTVGIVTKPFTFEGKRRRTLAEEGITALQGRVDTMITIPNDKLMEVAERRTAMTDAFRLADDVLRQGVQGISDIITIPGLINVDFADVKSVMSNGGPALMGIGYGVGEHRALQAAQQATASALLETTIAGARGLLVNFTAGEDLTLAEVSEAMDYIYDLSDDEEASIYFGAVVDPSMEGEVRITVLATGFDPDQTHMTDGPSAVRARRSAHEEIFQPRAVEAAPEPAPEAPKPNQNELADEVFRKDPKRRRLITSEPEPASTVEEDAGDIDIPAFLRKHRGKR